LIVPCFCIESRQKAISLGESCSSTGIGKKTNKNSQAISGHTHTQMIRRTPLSLLILNGQVCSPGIYGLLKAAIQPFNNPTIHRSTAGRDQGSLYGMEQTGFSMVWQVKRRPQCSSAQIPGPRSHHHRRWRGFN